MLHYKAERLNLAPIAAGDKAANNRANQGAAANPKKLTPAQRLRTTVLRIRLFQSLQPVVVLFSLKTCTSFLAGYLDGCAKKDP
jgi:hypothetical protein